MNFTPRQIEFADAALRLLARGGMSQVSFRAVAAEAGVSLGAIQKAFPTKADMLRVTFSRLRERASHPVLGAPGRPTLRAWLIELIMSVLPLDEKSRALQMQGAAFSRRAAFDPDIAAAIIASDHELRGKVAYLFQRAQGEGEIDGTIPASAASWAVFTFIDGLANQLLYDPMPREPVRAQVEYFVELLLGPEDATE